MSLLMDALKKAEEEKKQAAKRLEQVEANARSATNEIEDNNISIKGQDIENENQAQSAFLETTELSLEPIAEQFNETKDALLEEQEKDTASNEIAISTVDKSDALSEEITLENTAANELFDKTAGETGKDL